MITMVALLAPVWLPMLLTGIYAFVIRDWLTAQMRPTADKVYWWVYFGLWLVAMGLFVTEIFGWQMALIYRWLWFVVLGIPMLMAMFIVLYLSIMAADSWF